MAIRRSVLLEGGGRGGGRGEGGGRNCVWLTEDISGH